MTTAIESIDPSLCPLCKQANHCGNRSSCGSQPDCWCYTRDIAFTQPLLDQAPLEAKGKACICQACALAHTANHD
ncbi:cysteine-rich CWC family protein [Amphritea sp.]|uniref:cysteine-rich CWC family protein n=1 Tax=Amphritea sp. TaxID=1872502 RepID=UPI003A91111B